MIDNEQYGMNKYMVLGACAPSDIPQYVEYTIIRDIERIAKHCNLVDGIFHVQFILDNENYPVMIDPCRRIPGDLYILLAKYVTGVNYPYEIVKAECGNCIQDKYIMGYNFVARECIMASNKGIGKKVHIEEEIKKYVVYSLIYHVEGIYIDEPLKFKAGILIMKFNTYREMIHILNHYEELVWIEMEET